MPLTLLEAMSFGKLSVVSDIEECISVIKNNKYGISFEKSNTSNLYEALKKASELENDDISSNIKEYIKKDYDWNKISSSTRSVYIKTCNKELKQCTNR